MKETPPEQSPENRREEREVSPVEELLLSLSKRINKHSPHTDYESQGKRGSSGIKSMSFADIMVHGENSLDGESSEERPLSEEEQEIILRFIAEGDEIINLHQDEFRTFLQEHEEELEKAGIEIDPERISEVCTQLTLEFLRGELALNDPEHERDRHELAILIEVEERLRAKELSKQNKS